MPMPAPFAPGLPDGTVTFLFTYIEESAELWEAYPRQMSSAMAQHDAILRSTIVENGCDRFTMTGDAICAVFDAPADAMRAGTAAQQALHAAEWPEEIGVIRVKMVIQSGEARLQGGDFGGRLLDMASRLLSAGHGGQVLLSQFAHDLVYDMLPPGVALSDLGVHRLKDLFHSEHIYQIVMPGLPSDFPPLRTLDSRPNNLPLQPTPLIGIEREVVAITRALERPDVRLLTLVGAGGMGKSRIALQVGANLLDRFSDGVWVADLSTLPDDSMLVPAIARLLRVKDARGRPLIETLKAYLKNKQLLLVLENFEQIGEAAHVSDLLEACPQLKVLITSGMHSKAWGGKAHTIPSLACPDPYDLPPLEKLIRYEAVSLFIARATAVKADFEVTGDNASSVVEICTLLQGIPLAIELVAARINMFPPDDLLARLSSNLQAQRGNSLFVSSLRQNLRGILLWSYDLLPEGHKELFRRMAVFNGGYTLEQLERVCIYDAGSDTSVSEGVEALLTSNLLRQREGRGNVPRFWMPETLREFGRAKLRESPESELVNREHAFYFARLVEEAESQLISPKEQEGMERLEDEYDNIIAALCWASTWAGIRERLKGWDLDKAPAQRAEIGLRIGGTIWRFWIRKGLNTEGRMHLKNAISTAKASREALQRRLSSSAISMIKARALNGAAVLAECHGDYASARPLAQAALALGREVEDKQSMAFSMNVLGIITSEQGDYTAARALFEESLALSRELGDKRAISLSLYSLALLAGDQGNDATARDLFEEDLALSKELEDERGIAYTLGRLGHEAYEQGDYTRSRTLYEESLALQRGLGDKRGTAVCLVGLGGVAVREGQVERGATLLGAVEEWRQSKGASLYREALLQFEQSVKEARALLKEEFERAWQAGRAMSMEAAIERASDVAQ